MGARLSTGATLGSGTKDASTPVTKYKPRQRLRLFTIVEEGNVEVIESFGRFKKMARPGFHLVFCCGGQAVAGRLSTALQHQEVQCECKTRDGVFVELVFSVQYRVTDDRLYEAFFSLSNPASQVTSYVLDGVGTAVSEMEIEQLFLHKGEMVTRVRQGLAGKLRTHGFTVHDCLVTVLTPTATVKEAMSNVKAAQRLREAAYEQGEADKVRTIKHAEASAASQYMRGQGLARFLLALSAGVRDSVRVMVTGRINDADLCFPDPPPGNDTAALAAAAVAAPPPRWHQEGQLEEEEWRRESEAEQHDRAEQLQARKAPGGGAGELSRPLLSDGIAPATPTMAGAAPAVLAAPAQMTTTVRKLRL